MTLDIPKNTIIRSGPDARWIVQVELTRSGGVQPPFISGKNGGWKPPPRTRHETGTGPHQVSVQNDA